MICSNKVCRGNKRDSVNNINITTSKNSLKFHSDLALCAKCRTAFCNDCFNIHQIQSCISKSKGEFGLNCDCNEKYVYNSVNLEDSSNFNNSNKSSLFLSKSSNFYSNTSFSGLNFFSSSEKINHFDSHICGCFVCGIEGFNCCLVVTIIIF
jgi:hypothetical protein